MFALLRRLCMHCSTMKLYLPELQLCEPAQIHSIMIETGQSVRYLQRIAHLKTPLEQIFIQSPRHGTVEQLFVHPTDRCSTGTLFMEIKVKQTSVHESLTSPAVRHISRQHGIDLTQIKGSGKGNRILKADLLDFLEKNKERQVQFGLNVVLIPSSQEIIPVNATPSNATASNVTRMSKEQIELYHDATNSLTVPQLNYQQLISLFEIKKILLQSPLLSLESIITKIFSLALTKHPIINSIYHPAAPFLYQINLSHHFSIHTLNHVTPVPHVDTLSIQQIQSHLAQQHQHMPSKHALRLYFYSSGVAVQEVIVPPQTTVVAFGRVQENGINVSICCDHRVLDGATVATFIKELKNMMEKPYTLLKDLV